MARFAALFDQQAPPEHDVFRGRKDTLFKGRPHRMHQPIVQLGSSVRIADEFDAEADFGEGYHADVKQIEGLRSDECNHLRFRPSASQLREDIGVE